jgi:hypothetical protein
MLFFLYLDSNLLSLGNKVLPLSFINQPLHSHNMQ